MNSLAGIATATLGTVEKGAQTAEAAVGTAAQAAKMTENVGKVANTTLRSADETIESTNQALNTSIHSLNDQIDNLNKNTNTIMNITNDSLEKSRPHLANTVGNTTEMASRLTSTTNHSIEFGQNVVSSLFSILQYPFESIQQKIQDIKNNKEKPSKKMDDIKNEIIKKFSNTKNETLKNFSQQIDNLITNIDILINLFKSLSCEKNWLGYYEKCDDLIQTQVNAIKKKKNFINKSKDININNIENILNSFDTSIHPFWEIKISDNIPKEEFELKLTESVNKSQETQSIILSEAISKFSEIMKDYKEEIAKIEEFVKNILNKINEKIRHQDNTSDKIQSETTVMSGGRKNKSKKQRKGTKKINKRKSKTKKSKK